MREVYVIEGLRTPFTKAGKEFSNIHPSDLATHLLKEFALKMPVKKEEIDELILGHCFNLPDSSNIARVVALKAGFPQSLSASIVGRNCASSLESVASATAKIQAGFYDTALVGGVESMSWTPFMLSKTFSDKLASFLMGKSFKHKLKALFSLKPRDLKITFPVLQGLTDPLTCLSMGQSAELLAREWSISRKEQDEFAKGSHDKALKNEQKLSEEITPVFLKKEVVRKDKGVRKVSLERIEKFPPYFDKKYGTVSVANSCPINDGASLLLLMEKEKAKALGLKPLAKIKGVSFMGLEPERLGLGPLYSTYRVFKQTGVTLKDISLFELNEAFAAQVIACLKAFCFQKVL